MPGRLFTIIIFYITIHSLCFGQQVFTDVTTDAGVNHSFRVHKDLFGGGAFNLAEKCINGIVVTDLPEQLNQELEMYPNPARNQAIVTLRSTDLSSQESQLSVTDIHGKNCLMRWLKVEMEQ